jgi:hypothetical protein
MAPLLNAISKLACFQPGKHTAPRPYWIDQEVVLEVPTGELAKDWLTSMAILGRRDTPQPVGLTGKENFNAQGLEGKVQIKKDLFSALMNLRDVIPEHRGRILTGGFDDSRIENDGSAVCGSDDDGACQP